MPWPDFSELSFGYAFLREFERAHPKGKFPAAPDFISQAVEATKGYDVSVLSDSTPVFLQFKRSFVLTTSRAKEIQKGDFPNTPLYRVHLHEKGAYRQHRALQELESSGECVFYVTSQIPDSGVLSSCYSAHTILNEASALIAPSEISLPDLINKHHITFAANTPYFELYSDEGERHERQTSDWEKAMALLGDRRRSAEENTASLERVVEVLGGKRRSPVLRALPDDPAIAASILAFTELDAHLMFYKP